MTMIQILKVVAAVLSLLRRAEVMSTIQAGILVMISADLTKEQKHQTVKDMVLRLLAQNGATYSGTIIDAAIKLVYAVIAKKV